MNKLHVNEVSIAEVLKLYEGSHIGNEILLFDHFAEVPIPDQPRRMKCLLVGLCLKGKAQYSVDTEEHLITANNIIIISEGQVIDDYMASRDFDGVAIMMSPDFFGETIKGIHDLASLFLFSRTHPVCDMRKDEVDSILKFFGLIKEKVDMVNHPFRTYMVRALIMALIYDVGSAIYRSQQQNGKKQTRAESIFTAFIRLVEKNFRQERRVSWYGEQLCITPKYLSECVKHVSRRTPNEWIDNYVTLEVRVLLKNSTMSIKEIAQYLNFSNQSFLGKYFKEHVGMSPSEYRKL